ncbi:paraquat-inducible protein A [Parendozoicomonas sp. Alg238-R29]|uniref:paraquat-inducible protein A n=1 Tax=Parendozoicomonas sp. Alg238-R29 TaxID=2993446 RepID=UPI00248E7973|nr:paraquat-inducible protein A [Parendozoicomonas sp. Alg238-R29]
MTTCRALTLAGLILYIPANLLPVLEITMSGETSSNTVFSGVVALWQQQLFAVSVLVFLFAILAPFLRLSALFFVLLPKGTLKGSGLLVMRFHHALHGWGMMDIFLLGALVAVVKMQDFAAASVETGAYCLAAMMLMEIKASHILPKQNLWRRFKPDAFLSGCLSMRKLYLCLICEHTCVEHSLQKHLRCSRCGSALFHRKPSSLSRTWALLIAAAVLYIPANLLPIMQVISFGKGEANTIMSGVVALARSGMVPIAVLVFTASIVVPLFKIMGLAILLLNVHGLLNGRLTRLSRLYRFIEWIGRWSMLDIFMISILVSLVQLRVLEILAGPGATAFVAVVILTIFASRSFDLRLLWDRHHPTTQ